MRAIGYILAIIIILAFVAGVFAGPQTMVLAVRKEIPSPNMVTISNSLQSIGITFKTNDCALYTDGSKEWLLCAVWAQQGTSQAKLDNLKGLITNPTKFKGVFTNIEEVANTITNWGFYQE